MTYKTIAIKKENDDLIKKCIYEYRRHHPEFNEMPISYNKILYEMAKLYLRV